MSLKPARLLAVIAIAIACVAVLSAAALGRGQAHADLRILSGSVRRTGGTRAQPVYTGTFRVANVGNANTRALRARVELTAAKRPARILSVFSPVSLKAGESRTLRPKVRLPRGLARVSWTVEACVVLGDDVKAKPARHGCRKLATYDLATKSATVVKSAPAPPATAPVVSATPTTPTTPVTPVTPVSTVPAQPLTGYTVNSPYWVPDGLGQYEGQANAQNTDPTSYGGYFASGYYAVVPPSYDKTNQTPETLVVWMHGCYGTAHWDAQDLTAQFDTDRPYILISLSGPEDDDGSAGPSCWDTGDQTDVNKVLTDIANVETHFNINRRRVIIAGYSSGGDLAYQTIFEHAATFAGILAYNTNPVRDNIFGLTYGRYAINNAIAGAAWKFPVIQISHSGDDTYRVNACGYSDTPACDTGGPDPGVAPAISALQTAGFAATLTVLSGGHYNADTPDNCQDSTPSTCTGGDSYAIVHDLLNTVATDGWQAPAP